MINNPRSVNISIIGLKNDQVRFTRSLVLNTCRSASRKRSISRSSCAKAFTTRTPGIVSASTLSIIPQARPDAAKELRKCPRTHLTSQATIGTGPNAANANSG